jgi:hypothetical protein
MKTKKYNSRRYILSPYCVRKVENIFKETSNRLKKINEMLTSAFWVTLQPTFIPQLVQIATLFAPVVLPLPMMKNQQARSTAQYIISGIIIITDAPRP